MSPPTGAAVISGYELDTFWQPLIGSTGPLIQFSLIAYDTLRADVPPIVYTYNDTNMNSSKIHCQTLYNDNGILNVKSVIYFNFEIVDLILGFTSYNECKKS